VNRRSRTVSLVSLRFLLFAGCVSMQSACQPPAAAPAAPAAAPPAGRGAGGSATSRPTRRRNLDRAGNARPWFPLLRRVARSPDQCAGPIVRHGFACTQYRHTNTKFGADAGRELLRKHAGERVGIKTRAPVDSYRQVFGRHGKRNLRQ